jgi:hypothetical protein
LKKKKQFNFLPLNFLGREQESGFVIQAATNKNILSTEPEQIQGGLKLSSEASFLSEENPETEL